MSKKTIKIILSVIILLFSFYYTNRIIKISREKDEIMIEIMNYEKILKDTKVEAIVSENTIIPGLKGEKINIEDSYIRMKKVGEFDKKLLIFEDTYPKETLNSNYDKFIISGNKNKINVSLIFEVKDSQYIKDILSVLKSKNITATFFISSDTLTENVDLIKIINDYGHDIELLSDSYSTYEINKYSSLLKLVSKDKLSFCLTKDNNKNILSRCEKSKLHTIIPTITVEKNLYNTIKHNLENGSIILINTNKNNINELSSTINYIYQKGKKIILLKNLLEE